jgi:hypothetical protein
MKGVSTEALSSENALLSRLLASGRSVPSVQDIVDHLASREPYALPIEITDDGHGTATITTAVRVSDETRRQIQECAPVGCAFVFRERDGNAGGG